jgi:hypothetical protein
LGQAALKALVDLSEGGGKSSTFEDGVCIRFLRREV